MDCFQNNVIKLRKRNAKRKWANQQVVRSIDLKPSQINQNDQLQYQKIYLVFVDNAEEFEHGKESLKGQLPFPVTYIFYKIKL